MLQTLLDWRVDNMLGVLLIAFSILFPAYMVRKQMREEKPT